MKISQFTRVTHQVGDGPFGFYVRPRVWCRDGFNISIQGGEGSYSTPRKNVKEFMAMECGYPNRVEELILEFADDPANPTETIYGWVPIEIIQQVIDKHGGIDLDQTIPSLAK